MGGSLNANHLLFLGQGALWTIGLSAIALIGGGIESWLAYFIALGFLLFRPQGLFGDKIIERI